MNRMLGRCSPELRGDVRSGLWAYVTAVSAWRSPPHAAVAAMQALQRAVTAGSGETAVRAALGELWATLSRLTAERAAETGPGPAAQLIAASQLRSACQ